MAAPAFDVVWRPNYELGAAYMWGAAAVVAMVAPWFLPLPPEPFWAMAGLGTVMALARGPAGWRLRRRHRALRGQSLEFITPKQLIQKAKKGQQKKKPSREFMGTGFEWTQTHAQLAYDFIRRDKNEILQRYAGMSKKQLEEETAPWLHGLEPKQRPLYMSLKDREGHVLLAGTTGSGKTRALELQIFQAIWRSEPVIILDPKGDQDLCRSAKFACEAIGAPEKFHFFHPAYPEQSVRVSPLKNFQRASQVATRIAVLIPSESGADPFSAFGQMALNNVVQGLLMAGYAPNLVNIRRFIEGGVAQLLYEAIAGYLDRQYPQWEGEAAEYLKQANTEEKRAWGMVNYYKDRLPTEYQTSDLEGLISMFTHDREHFQKMIASLLPVLNMLTTGELASMLSPDPEDPEDDREITDLKRIVDSGGVLYIGLDSLSDSMVGQAVGSIFMADATSLAGARYNYHEGEITPVALFIDEAHEAVAEPMIQALNKGRGAGFRMTLATQTLADFEAALGDQSKARKVLGNLNTYIALRTKDADTQQYIAESFPETAIQHVMRTQGTSTDGNDALDHKGNVGERLMEEQLPLIPQQLLGQLPNLEYVCNTADGRLLKGKLPILNREAQ